MPIEILVSSNHTAARNRIDEILVTEARELGLAFDDERFAFEAKDGDTWIGGIAGMIFQGWVCVQFMAVSPGERGQGIGSRLLEMAESLAKSRDLVGVWLDTHTSQAPGFYAKLGYEEIGRISDCPPGHACIFLAKRIDGDPIRPETPAV